MDKEIKLLMVDDDIEFLDAIAERLIDRGFAVAKAHDGEQALELVEHERFDLALVDLRMPGMDGKELLAALKAKHKHLEVVILTGQGTQETAFECSKLGAFGYLRKPFDIDELLHVLKDAFEERMRGKFERDEERAAKLAQLSMGTSALGLLRAMKELDDEEK